MILNHIETVSIYADCFEVLQAKPPGLPVPNPCDVAKCFLTNTKKTCEAILRGNLSKFDPIVGENGCQIRALAALKGYLDSDLKAEAQRVHQLVEILLKKVNGIRNQPCKYFTTDLTSIPEKLKQLQLLLEVSPKLDYLCRAHLLTVGKFFCINRQGRETSGIEVARIGHVLKANLALLEAIVPHSQCKLAAQSIPFIQEEARALLRGEISHLENPFIRQIQVKERLFSSSCALFNLKAVLQRVNSLHIPIMLKGHSKDDQRKFIFPEGKLHPNQPLLVIEGFFRQGIDIREAVNQVGLVNLILANVACVKQYSVDDQTQGLLPAAQEEIAIFRQIGNILECQTPKPVIFSVVHVHAATAREVR